ncbi:MAG TPA: Hpt domain-containing protein [Solirubrobacteraceae bacterium]|jgi:HPt (histidine-containing phosphotransfer) domain-containing protein|nr:Hpt domain-containing protein [Solirubrobacteraceae bacterium]
MPGVEAELDVSRLGELQELLGTEVPAIVRTLVTELDGAVASIEEALDAGDLSEVAAAAHAGRNSALMVDAQPVLRVLKQLETCARNDEVEGAMAARVSLRRAWPRLRVQLQRAGDDGRG